jgi:beta-phosphoglucomutase
VATVRRAHIRQAGSSDSIQPAAVDPWCLRQTRWEPSRSALDESLFALANGSLGVRGGFEESASATDASFLAAVHERNPIEHHERFAGFPRATDTRVPIADGTRVAIELDGQLLDPHAAECLDFERVLDLRDGIVRRRMRLRTPKGATLQIESERLVAFDSDVLAIRFRLTSIDYSGPVSLVSSIAAARRSAGQGDDPRIGVAAGDGLAAVASSAAERHAVLVQRTRRSGIEIACAQAHRIGAEPLAFVGTECSDDRVAQRYRAELTPGQQVSIDKFVAYAAAAAAGGTAEQAGRTLTCAAADGFDRLARARQRVLAAFWQQTAVAIDGDPDAEFAMRFNMFHVMQSTSRTSANGTAAKGLTGEGYEGHCFWDTEVFVLPLMVFTAPAVAGEMLRCRHRALDAARANACDMNHRRGALFPWRTIAGRECSAHYPSGSAAYHINAAIAYAIGLYLDATEDVDFLLEAGAEMLFETARIWPQIGHFDPARGGRFGIHCVTGPDEYTALVDNSFYTNRMAQQHLLRAVAVWRQLATGHPAALAALQARLGIDEAEVEEWQLAAEAMQLPYDELHGIYAQDEAFLHRPRWPFDDGQPGRPLLLDCHPLTLYRHQVCKQADVVMALVLAGDGFEAERKRRSFDYYEAITTHDSTLSAPVFGILACELGLRERAWRYFHEGLQVDLDDRHGNTAHGVHMAAMAGSWLGLAWGFAGLRVRGGELSFAPMLPDGWTRYRFGLCWRGRRLQVETAADGTRYALLDGPPLPVVHEGRTVVLFPGAVERFARVDRGVEAAPRTTGPAIALTKATFPRRCAALVFDLDGVLTDTAQVHYRAWKRLADEIGVDFDPTVNRRLKGVDRMRSLQIILERAPGRFNAVEMQALAERKNRYYVEMIASFGPAELFPGALRLLGAARRARLKLALASSSRNATMLLQRLGIADAFDVVVDPARIARPKPDPEIFLAAARGLGVAPADCIGIEDAAAGIAAIKQAGMAAIGIGDPFELAAADAVLPSIAALRLDAYVRRSRRATKRPTAEKAT